MSLDRTYAHVDLVAADGVYNAYHLFTHALILLLPASLGPVQHTQYTLSPIPHVSHTIVSVALGQDHTLALTNLGEVLSWGLNRFAQLGYVVETVGAPITRLEEPVQSTPRKVSGLRGKFVRGVAACKTASVCWTEKEVYSWGTNNGQLGKRVEIVFGMSTMNGIRRLR